MKKGVFDSIPAIFRYKTSKNGSKSQILSSETGGLCELHSAFWQDQSASWGCIHDCLFKQEDQIGHESEKQCKECHDNSSISHDPFFTVVTVAVGIDCP